MHYTRLGSSGLNVSRVAMGTMSFGEGDSGREGWPIPYDDAVPFFRQALDLGITFWDTANATDAHGAQFIESLLTDELLTRIQELAPLAQAEGLTMAQLAVAWVLQNDNVASAITGGSRPEQVTDNAAAAGKSLSSETLAGIDDALGDAVERDGSLVGSMSPKDRPT
jgi:aryl-alcohol dehydrogenase-like predicted oxidoreductase